MRMACAGSNAAARRAGATAASTPHTEAISAICSAMGITLAQFFSEGRMVELTGEQKDLFDRWVSLTKEQKGLLYDLMKNMK